MAADASASWEKFLNPDALKQNLIAGGLYLAAFELLKSSLVGRPRDFYWNGFRNGKDLISPDYQEKVLSLHKHTYTASALWWRQRGAIDDEDIERLTEIREHRDQVAHNMPMLLSTIEHYIRIDLLTSCNDLLFKIDNWWIQNIEVATDPDSPQCTDQELAAATSISSHFLSLMLPIVAGDDSQLRALYQIWSTKLLKQ
ncbi:MAG: hypothetical protein WCQ16_00885 [Verrucomicrobiae bacterium]